MQISGCFSFVLIIELSHLKKNDLMHTIYSIARLAVSTGKREEREGPT